IIDSQRIIPCRTTRAQTRSNRAKRSLESSITTQATCPAKKPGPVRTSPHSRPTSTEIKAVTKNKTKELTEARRSSQVAGRRGLQTPASLADCQTSRERLMILDA